MPNGKDYIFDKIFGIFDPQPTAVKQAAPASVPVSVSVCDGHVEINGPFKSLRIDGKTVRFKT